MSLPLTWNDVLALGPIGIVFAGALLVLVIESLLKDTERWNFWITLTVLLVACGVALPSLGEPGRAFGGTLTTGGYAWFFAILFSLAGILTTLLSRQYVRAEKIEHSEYYVLLLVAIVGMMLMAAARDLVVFFLGLETMSIAFYVLAGFLRRVPASNEAALKYFLLGAFATGFLLYGIALLYGTTGTTSIDGIQGKLGVVGGDALFVIGLGLLTVGLAFKVAAVPFHMWVPDVYEGSPTPVSGFMSTGGKAAAFSAFLVLFPGAIMLGVPALREILAVLAVLSMVVGNIIAIVQTSLKRMLAYSSIAHAGYLLTGVLAGNAAGSNGVTFYLLAYTFMNIGAFGIVSLMERSGSETVRIDDCAGMSKSRPVLAGLMALFMFSLAGIPPLAGFFGKYYVFAGAIEAGYTWLAIVGVLMSVVSAYYYLRVVVVMYFRDGEPGAVPAFSVLSIIALVLSAATLVVLGILPSTILEITTRFF